MSNDVASFLSSRVGKSAQTDKLLKLLLEHTDEPKNNPIKVTIGAPQAPILVYVTAELAVALLESVHPRNRTSSKARVERLAQEILDGRWVLSHQGGALDDEGRVIDFVHRLKAIILANETAPGAAVPMWVFPNCAEGVFYVIDRGFARNQAHLFVAQGGGRDYAEKVCAIGRSMARGISPSNFKISPDDAVRVSLKHEVLIRQVLAECDFGQKTCPYYSNGWAGAFAKAALQHGPRKVLALLRRFVKQQTADGRALGERDPLRVLHTFLRLANETGKRGSRISKTRDWMQYPYAVTAIKAALRGDAIADTKALAASTLIAKPGARGNTKLTFHVTDFEAAL